MDERRQWLGQLRATFRVYKQLLLYYYCDFVVLYSRLIILFQGKEEYF